MRHLSAVLLAAASLSLPATPASRNGAAQAQVPVPVREGKATTPDGVELHYRVAGAGGPVVIAPFALYLEKALDPLARGRRIVTYDPRGRGRSQAVSPDKVSVDHLLIDVDTIRRAMRAERVALIGSSGAGMEMFVYALRNPGRVSRLVQLAPVAARWEPYGEQMMADREARTDPRSLASLRSRIAAGDFSGKPVEECRARDRVTGPAMMADPAKYALVPDVCVHANELPQAIGAYFEALFPTISGYDYRDRLGEVTIPRLVIYPERDNIPRAGVEEWVRGQPNARILYLEDSGHLPYVEQPEATIRAIDAFLDGRWPAGSKALP